MLACFVRIETNQWRAVSINDSCLVIASEASTKELDIFASLLSEKKPWIVCKIMNMKPFHDDQQVFECNVKIAEDILRTSSSRRISIDSVRRHRSGLSSMLQNNSPSSTTNNDSASKSFQSDSQPCAHDSNLRLPGTRPISIPGRLSGSRISAKSSPTIGISVVSIFGQAIQDAEEVTLPSSSAEMRRMDADWPNTLTITRLPFSVATGSDAFRAVQYGDRDGSSEPKSKRTSIFSPRSWFTSS
jgi:hypothetical protein